MQGPEAFISYSHDSEEHQQSVAELAARLRSDGVEAWFDLYEQSPPDGWPRWMHRMIEGAKFALLICTENYVARFENKAAAGSGKGVKWEGAILTQALYEAESRNDRFVPVVFRESDRKHIPIILKSATYYDLSQASGYEDLYRRLTGQPRVVAPPLGDRKSLPANAAPPPTAIAPRQTAQDLDQWITASRARWDELCRLNAAPDDPARLPAGRWSFCYALAEISEQKSLSDLIQILNAVRGAESGWPAWWVPTRPEIAPRPYRGEIECWLRDTYFKDPAHSDFWRVSPKGMLYLLRGYQEDGNDWRGKPGRDLEVNLPLYRVADCLLHAAHFADVTGQADTDILVKIKWEGLLGRSLTARSMMHAPPINHVAFEDGVEASTTVRAKAILQDLSLAKILEQLTQPLYDTFGFFKLPAGSASRVIAELRTWK